MRLLPLLVYFFKILLFIKTADCLMGKFFSCGQFQIIQNKLFEFEPTNKYNRATAHIYISAS